MNNVQVLPIRLDEKMYEELREMAYISKRPMAVIVREGIELRMNQIKKVLTNKDIAI